MKCKTFVCISVFLLTFFQDHLKDVYIYIFHIFFQQAAAIATDKAGEHKSCFAKRVFSSKCEWQHFYLICSQIQWNHLPLLKELKRQVWKHKPKLCKIITHTEIKYVLRVSVTEVLLFYFCSVTLSFTQNSTLLYSINAPNLSTIPAEKYFTSTAVWVNSGHPNIWIPASYC